MVPLSVGSRSALEHAFGLDLDLAVLPTITPPPSSTWFQLIPNASRSTSAVALTPPGVAPRLGGAALEARAAARTWVTPSTASSPRTEPFPLRGRGDAGAVVRDGGVALDVEEVGGTQVAVTPLVAGVDARPCRCHVDRGRRVPAHDHRPETFLKRPRVLATIRWHREADELWLSRARRCRGRAARRRS